MLTEKDFVTNEWVGCGGLHMVPLIKQVVAGRYKPRTLDMGCGCGAIGIALLLDDAIGELVMTDIDAESIKFALENIKRLVPAPKLPQVSCYIADVWERDGNLLAEAAFDLIVCNAPLDADASKVAPTKNPYRFSAEGGTFQRRLFSLLESYLVLGGLVVIKDLAGSTWFKEFPAVRLKHTIIGNEPTLQRSTQFLDLMDQEVSPHDHCLRVFERVNK